MLRMQPQNRALWARLKLYNSRSELYSFCIILCQIMHLVEHMKGKSEKYHFKITHLNSKHPIFKVFYPQYEGLPDQTSDLQN